MAKNKTSKFGVADNLKYRDEYLAQPQIDDIVFNNHSAQNLKKQNKLEKKSKREGAYRFSLYMDPDLGEYVNYIKFKQKKSITDFFNDLVREKMESDAGWKTPKK